TLVIATAGAARLAAFAANDTLVALPEAPGLSGAENVPDLATALRRHPGTARLRVIGHGLPPRDRPAAAGLALAFDPAPLPRGLIALALPPQTAPGAGFSVSGSANDVPGGRAELVDPAGQTVATAVLAPSGSFALTGTTRIAGPAEFALRIRNARGGLVEVAQVPIVAAVQPAPRILVVAGAAGPDLKYLRRWASDAGITMTASIAAGSGLDIGDAAPRLDAASLARLDLLVLDERSWSSLGAGQRAAVLAASRAGLGVVLRVTGPVPDAVRRDWAALGLPVSDSETPLRLAGGVPILSRLALASPDANAVPLSSDGGNTPIAVWRGIGRGRIGVWPVTGLYTLVLAGQTARHASIWSAIFGTLARPQTGTVTSAPAYADIGQRLALCNLSFPARILQPDGTTTALVADPAKPGCAVFWPRYIGWHSVQTGAAATVFLVGTPGPGLIAAEARLATWQLQNDRPQATATTHTPGSLWPWFAAWLVMTAVLGWLERSRLGRPVTISPATTPAVPV
ncbi:MAG: carboxypeptidase regulatory-like domain-containing protein, partial [Sandarakinorhabdus sp.]|nr:carboxypeptidase regulatory-like domain-containing protein [Sandarakinorhabdus sp.]